MKFDILKIMELQYDRLPIAVQEYINDNEWEKIIANLASNFRLHKEQREAIEAVTLYTMVGISKVEDFTQSIMDDAKIDPSIANEIAKGINLNVFEEIAQITEAVERDQAQSLSNDDSLIILDDARTTEDKVTAEEEEIKREFDERERTFDSTKLRQIDPNNKEDMAAEALLNEIENHRETFPQTTTERADTHLQNNVDTIMGGQTPPGEPTAPQVAPGEPQVDSRGFSQEDTKKPATHMRTLKSDIVREKMDNPSWSPNIKEVRDPEMKEITEEALNQVSNRPSSSHQNNDPYREITE